MKDNKKENSYFFEIANNNLQDDKLYSDLKDDDILLNSSFKNNNYQNESFIQNLNTSNNKILEISYQEHNSLIKENNNNNNITINNFNFPKLKKHFTKKVKKIKEKEKEKKSMQKKSQIQKPLFEIYNNIEDIQRKKKLLMNRISAKKSRLKKKKYINFLEEELKKNKNLIENKKKLEKYILPSQNENENNYIYNALNDYDLLIQKQEKILNGKDIDDNKINEYKNLQQKVLKEIIVKQIHLLYPIKCKIFSQKYLKLKNFSDDDSFSTIKNKIDLNIDILKELYNFNENDLIYCRKNESKAFQLFSFFYHLKELMNSFLFIESELNK